MEKTICNVLAQLVKYFNLFFPTDVNKTFIDYCTDFEELKYKSIFDIHMMEVSFCLPNGCNFLLILFFFCLHFVLQLDYILVPFTSPLFFHTTFSFHKSLLSHHYPVTIVLVIQYLFAPQAY